jgi:peptide chain release factor 2
LRRCGGIFDIDQRTETLKALEDKAADPSFWNDQNLARDIIGQSNRERAVLKPYEEIRSLIEDAELLLEMGRDEADEAQRAEVLNEASAGLKRAEAGFDQLELQSLLSGRFDANGAYLTLHAGAGGTESCDWADMLLRMYRRFCERNDFSCELIEMQAGDEAGIRRVTIAVEGAFAYGYMKAERGVHRLVRISPFDSNKRRHTSFVALDVVAALDEEIEVEILDEELRVDTFRASGAGGQHVNTTDSAVRITHLPTGIVVACQAERSQHKNRSKAMKVLRAKVYEWNQDQKRKELERFYGQKGEIAWGSQIRSYVMQPYTLVKDHRTGAESSNVTAVLDGEIQPFIELYLKQHVGEEDAEV